MKSKRNSTRLTTNWQRPFPPRDRESLKQEQLKWLATREHITAAEKDKKESIQLRLTRRRVAELETTLATAQAAVQENGSRVNK